jgi:hypothetical protein
LLALYDAIENDASASGGGSTKGCQAVGATTALLALLSNDMLAPMGGGMSASHIYESFYSDEFIGLAQTFGPLVVLHKQDGLFDEFKLSLVSLQMLFLCGFKKSSVNYSSNFTTLHKRAGLFEIETNTILNCSSLRISGS